MKKKAGNTDTAGDSHGHRGVENPKSLKSVVTELCDLNGDAFSYMHKEGKCMGLPSRDVIVEAIGDLRMVLFPGYFGHSDLTPDTMHFYLGSTLDRISQTLKDQLQRGLCFVCTGHPDPNRCQECAEQAKATTGTFISRLPDVRDMLAADVEAAFEGDPAATSPDETIFCYPGIVAITNYRLAHELYRLDVPLIPRMITEHAHGFTGIDIHPGATIGKSFFIDHGTGIVIGETCRIGDRVKVYQGVTLGAKSFPLDGTGKPIKGIERHPIVEDDVIIYSGATILGRVTIGKGSTIGGNVWLTHSVGPGSRITQQEARSEQFQQGAGI